jgi:iron complex outermembrane receptor protein
LYVLATSVVLAQTASEPAEEPRRDAIVVTGTYEPLPLEEAERSVRTFEVRRMELVTNSLADFLKLEPSVDLRQRAPNGVQADISIRGGTFGQTLVLLNGMRLNDPQSGHHNFDIPAPLESISRMEILKGSGSTLYGSDAVGGVVHIITAPPETSEVRLRAALGSFGTNQQRATATVVRSNVVQQLAVSRDFSTGFIPNRDYRNLSIGSTTNVTTPLGVTDVHLAHNDRPFGAEQFYGNFNSWERTKSWWAGVRQSFNGDTDVAFAYRRHTDLFVLYRDRPSVFTNRHAAESYQGVVRRRSSLGANVKLHYGGEVFHDSILSNNLGVHDRTRGAAYTALDVRALKRFAFSAGIRDEIWGSGNHQWSPTVSVGYWMASSVKVRGSVSRAFRLPTFTDLYYHDPANVGSPDLQPEQASSYEAGLDYNAGGRLRAVFTFFQRYEQNGIDYVRRHVNDIWRATNFQELTFSGVEASVDVRLPRRQIAGVQYTGLHGTRAAVAGLQSKYVFNYPVHTGLLTWSGSLPFGIVGRSRVGVLERLSRDPYAVWDVYGAATRGRVRPFLQFTNLTSARYEEIPGVAMPGRAVVGGVELVVVTGR